MIIRNAWKQILYDKYNSMILWAALVIGFLFPLLAVNDINDVIRDGEVAKYEDASKISVLEYLVTSKIGEEEMEASIIRCQEEGMFQKAGYSVCLSEIVYSHGRSYSCSISGISKEYLSLAGYELIEGVFFSDEDYAADGENVCLLSYRSALQEQNIRVGDLIEILGESYRVKGIVRAPRAYGSVFLPYGAVSFSVSSGSPLGMQYQIITYGERKGTPMLLAKKVFPFLDSESGVSAAQTGEEQEEWYYGSMWEVNRYRVLRAILVAAFAGVSLALLFAGMILRGRYDMAVRIALGAGRGKVLMESAVRNILLMCIAFLTALILYPCFTAVVSGAGSHLLFRTVVQVGLTGTVFIILINSAVFFAGFRKRDIATLLKG